MKTVDLLGLLSNIKIAIEITKGLEPLVYGLEKNLSFLL
jgi:hypothetical protein